MTIVDENIHAGIWPEPFEGCWINIFISRLGNEVISLYKNNENTESTVLFDQNYQSLPDAYLSVRENGEIYEIFVRPSLQRERIGATLCAWARSYFLNKDIVLMPPNEGMSDDANMLYNYLHQTYGEPYNRVGPSIFLFAYKDFNGGIDLRYIE